MTQDYVNDYSNEVIEFEEAGIHYVYSSHFDMHGYGYTIEEARTCFKAFLKNLIEYSESEA